MSKVESNIKKMEKRVLRTDRSPMNAKRWCCELECGHEVWVTRDRAPKKTFCDKGCP